MRRAVLQEWRHSDSEPDSTQEFKVQTGLYDAGYGRYGGANVSVVTKTGSNACTDSFRVPSQRGA
jgi:hypothetical protein